MSHEHIAPPPQPSPQGGGSRNRHDERRHRNLVFKFQGAGNLNTLCDEVFRLWPPSNLNTYPVTSTRP